jgi:hypothetical protein
VKILRSRRTRHFVLLLVECPCDRRFAHRADRLRVACYRCGRVADLRQLRRPASWTHGTGAGRRPSTREVRAGAAARRARVG